MIKITIDVVLTPLMRIGNVACACLTLIVINATAINLVTITFLIQ